jgi:hypothetical protein
VDKSADQRAERDVERQEDLLSVGVRVDLGVEVLREVVDALSPEPPVGDRLGERVVDPQCRVELPLPDAEADDGEGHPADERRDDLLQHDVLTIAVSDHVEVDHREAADDQDHRGRGDHVQQIDREEVGRHLLGELLSLREDLDCHSVSPSFWTNRHRSVVTSRKPTP